MSDKISINDELNTVVINNVNQNITITTDGIDNEVSVTHPTTNVVIVNESTPSITIVENNVEESNNDQITVRHSTIDTSIVSVEVPDPVVLVINTPGPQGPQGPAGPPGTIDGVDISAFVLTSSFNPFTASYYIDSASFDARINAGGGGVNLSGYVTTSSFNSFTSSYTTGSFTGSFTGAFIGTSSWAVSASRAVTSSYSIFANNASGSLFAQHAASSTVAFTANVAEEANTANFATQASYANFTDSASGVIIQNNVKSNTDALRPFLLPLNRLIDETGYYSGLVESTLEYLPAKNITYYRTGSNGQRAQLEIGQLGSNQSGRLIVYGEVWSSGAVVLPSSIKFVDTINTASFNNLTDLSFKNSSLILSTGSFSGSFSGSFFGTASNSLTASWANNYLETDPIFTSKSASLATTGSNIFKASQVITGSLTITNDLIVLGSSSINYISQSTLDIATNLIRVNTNTPSVRFGGLAVIDSGSSPQRSGSILFDSQNNQWIFVHQGSSGQVTSSVFIQGPQTFNNLGNEATITTNRLTKGTGGDLGEHIGDSNITDTGTLVSINSNTEITGSLTVSGSTHLTNSSGTTVFSSNADTLIITGSLLLTGSMNVVGLIYGSSSYALTASYIDGGFY